MSIASEITRLQGVKSDILTAIGNKGVTVPAGSALDDCPALIANIPSGGGDADLSDFFERRAIYWNNTSNAMNPFKTTTSITNEDLIIKGHFYVPTVASDNLFFAGNGSSYSGGSSSGYAYIYLQSNATNAWLSNGKNAARTIADPGKEIEIEIDGSTFKLNGATYTGGFQSLNINYVWPLPNAGSSSGHATDNRVALRDLTFIKKSTDTVVGKWVGSRRKTDGALGVLDFVGGSFYTTSYMSSY